MQATGKNTMSELLIGNEAYDIKFDFALMGDRISNFTEFSENPPSFNLANDWKMVLKLCIAIHLYAYFKFIF